MTNVLIPITVFVIVIVVHEVAHGYAAYRLGDPTAKEAGRLTLNPVAHVDPVGTVLLPALLVATHSPVIFGWAKPVPVNPRNFRDPRKGLFLTSLAGPGANFLLAVLFAALFKVGIFPVHSAGGSFLFYGVIISLILGIFNLVPVPPLDGANIVAAVLPLRFARKFMQIEKYGFLILIALLYFGLFDRVIIPIVEKLTVILLST